MSIRLTSLQQQVQKEIEALERETRGMREQLAARDEEADAMRKALRALEGKSEKAEPVQRRSAPEQETEWRQNQHERVVMREGILKHLQAKPGLTSAQLAKLMALELPEADISPFRITKLISFMSSVVGDSGNGWMYVPEENAGDGQGSK